MADKNIERPVEMFSNLPQWKKNKFQTLEAHKGEGQGYDGDMNVWWGQVYGLRQWGEIRVAIEGNASVGEGTFFPQYVLKKDGCDYLDCIFDNLWPLHSENTVQCVSSCEQFILFIMLPWLHTLCICNIIQGEAAHGQAHPDTVERFHINTA